MKTITKIVALALVIVMAFSLFAITASAASSKSGTNIVATVVTSKRPWYALRNPTITIKNTGNTPMTVNIEYANGSLASTLSNLKPGKSHTFTLKYNQTYTVYWSGNAWGGSIYARGTLTAGRNIQSIS